MTISIPASITGAAQTGFTSPTYTMTADTQPDVNAKQSVVTALGGTQAGVTVHSVSVPFFCSVWKPKKMAALGKANPVTGIIANVPTNQYKVLTQKGVVPAANQVARPLTIRTLIDVPAGADSHDLANVRAALAAHIGLLWAQSSGIGDTAGNGTL